jgi:hypothetical protein
MVGLGPTTHDFAVTATGKTWMTGPRLATPGHDNGSGFGRTGE